MERAITQIIRFGDQVGMIYLEELILKFMKWLDDTQKL